MSEQVQLGPFRLLSPLARGATGEVWRGIHVEARLPVAVKVLQWGAVADGHSVAGFHNEVRAIAALDHPHIVTLLDAGVVPASATAQSGGRLVEGSPWLAMEYASDGTLATFAPTRFEEARSVLLTILDALAHAHARGVVHRDLKPANVLVCGERDVRPGLKLSDFGIATRSDQTGTGPGASAGTPKYMAPEQLLGYGHDIGPWTDLYALGVLGWKLLTGDTPFAGRQGMMLVRAHLREDPPAFSPRVDCPEGVESWLLALLSKRVEDRPQRAADAREALVAVDEVLQLDWTEEEEVTQTLGVPHVLPDEPTRHGKELEDVALDAPLVSNTTRAMGPPPFVPDWRQPEQRRPPKLMGAGLGLYGLRSPPMVGRVSEQELLWKELREVHGGGRPRVVQLLGPTGTGKSRLGRWLCERADEVGAATVVAIQGSLEEAITHLHRVEGLEGRSLVELLDERLEDPEEVRTIAALLRGELSAGARLGAVVRGVLRCAAERPVVLWIDDAHHQADALLMAAELVQTRAPVLVVLAASYESLPERPEEAVLLDELGGVVLELGPLDAQARRALVRDLLGLEGGLASEVEARTAGNPLFASQLIGGWVEQGWLQLGERGFTLREGVALELPADMGEAWTARVDRVLAGLPPAAGWDLEVAAALGIEVDEVLWNTACDDPEGEGIGWERGGLRRRARMLERMMRAHLTRGRTTRWSFGHSMLRESIIRVSRARGRWGAVNGVCANALRLHASKDGERIGRHLLEAGDAAHALRPLLGGVEEKMRRAPRMALPSLLLAEKAAAGAGLAPSAPISGRLLVTRAAVHLALGELDEALKWARWGQQAATTYHPNPADPGAVRDGERWTVYYRRALQVELDVLLERGERRAASQVMRRLAPCVRAAGEVTLLGDLLHAQARIQRDRTVADSLLLEAERYYTLGARSDRLAVCLLRRAENAADQGALEEAGRLLGEAERRVDGQHDRLVLGRVLARRAEVLLRDDEVEEALAVGRRAVAVLESLGRSAIEARVVFGLALSEQGEHREASAQLLAALRDVEERGEEALRGLVGVAGAVVESRLGRWSAVHDRLRLAEEAAAEGLLGTHAREVAERLRVEAVSQGFPQLAARAQGLTQV